MTVSLTKKIVGVKQEIDVFHQLWLIFTFEDGCKKKFVNPNDDIASLKVGDLVEVDLKTDEITRITGVYGVPNVKLTNHLVGEWKEEKNTMKSKNAASILIDDLKTVGVQFEASGQSYTYKTIDDTLCEGDKVVVEARGHFKVASVVEIHKVPQISLDSTYDYKWIIQKIDDSHVRELEAREEAFSERILEMEQRKIKEQALEALGVDKKDLAKEIEDLNNRSLTIDQVQQEDS